LPAIYTGWPALRMLPVLMATGRLGCQVSVCVVTVTGEINPVRGRIVSTGTGREIHIAALGDIAEGIECESLLPNAGWTVRARHAGNASQIIMCVIAGLIVGRRDVICDLQLLQAAVGIPGQLPYIRLVVHAEGIVRQAAGGGTIG